MQPIPFAQWNPKQNIDRIQVIKPQNRKLKRSKNSFKCDTWKMTCTAFRTGNNFTHSIVHTLILQHQCVLRY